MHSFSSPSGKSIRGVRRSRPWTLHGADREGLVAHMRRAIRLGATKEELFEVLEATLVPGGAPTFHRGLSALIEVDEA